MFKWGPWCTHLIILYLNWDSGRCLLSKTSFCFLIKVSPVLKMCDGEQLGFDAIMAFKFLNKKKCYYAPLQWGIDEIVSSETDVIGSKYCLPLLKGFWVGGMDFCCSKSHQQLVSTRSSGIMTWGTISAVLLLSTVCILWSFSLCCCMTTNPVTAELQQLSVLSI